MTTEHVRMSVTLDAENVRRTNDGYLTAQARVARTGVQIYKGFEVGAPDMKKVRVYRPEDEVFHKDSLSSYAHKPVTNDHPPVMVDSASWKKYAVGNVGGEVARDGEFVVVPLVLMDDGAIRSVERGKKELSLGYECDLVWDAGTSPDGETYDAVQRNIRANHLAVVAVARGGPNLKIGDEDETEITEMQKHIVDGISVEMSDTAIQVVDKAMKARDETAEKYKAEIAKKQEEIAALKEKLKGADSATTDAATAHSTAIAAKDAEIVTLKKQLDDAEITPAKLDALVTERQGVIDKAKAVLGDKLVTDGKSIADIRRQVVDHAMGDTSKGWSDAEVNAGFGVICKDAKTHANKQRDSLATVLSSSTNVVDGREAAYEERENHLRNAWKGKSAA